MSEPNENPETEKVERTPHDPELEQVIEKISTEHGFDVRGYKRSTLYRRIRKRMADAGCPGVEDYLVRLETDRHEHPALINTILINVTEFFRDPEAWEFLQEHCLSALVRRRSPGTPIRVWSVGCATGEEAYSIAISLAEVLEDGGMRDVKIYATDMDEGALAAARIGLYSDDDLKNVSPARLGRWFEEVPLGRYRLRRELRTSVIFGRHNVLVDPPISRLDLLVCRNLLIYFDTDTQQQLLSRFHYAVRDENYLFLGKAETLMSRSMLFRPLEPRYRIFQRVPQHTMMESVAFPLNTGRSIAEDPANNGMAGQNYTLHAVVDGAADPVLLLDPAGRIEMASGRGREVFHITDAMMRRSFLDLDERLRPVALRIAIEDARSTGRAAQAEELEVTALDGRRVVLRMQARPILDPRGNLLHLLLWGRDVTLERTLSDELAQVRQELETTGEELQTTNEELETTNEELQSTNEELETTIEELQSTNEELETANDEMRARQEDLNLLTEYQQMVLSSFRVGLIVINREGVVTTWNRWCEDTWGLRVDETLRRHLFSLDIGLPLERLQEPLGRVLRGASDAETLSLDATNRRGRGVRCGIRITPLVTEPSRIEGALIQMENTEGTG